VESIWRLGSSTGPWPYDPPCDQNAGQPPMNGEGELNPLAPTAAEIGLALLSLTHVLLVAVVIVQVLRGRLAIPHGLLGLAVLLFMPVLGPLLVLTWQGRLDRAVARARS